LLAPHIILGLFVFAVVQSRNRLPDAALSLDFLGPFDSPMFIPSVANRLWELFLFIQLPVFILFLALASVASGVVTGMALNLLGGRGLRPASSLLASLRCLPQLLWGTSVLAALIGVLIVLPSVAIRAFSVLLFAILGLSGIALVLVSGLSLFAPVALSERRGTIASLRRSWNLTRAARLPILGAYFVLTVVAFVIWVMASLATRVLPPWIATVGATLGGAIFAIGSAVTYDFLVRYHEGSPPGHPAGVSNRVEP
jgi:hypothetical protein